jgi:methyltransferase
MAAARLVELAWSARNLRRAGAASEGRWSRQTYPAIVLVHASVIGGTALLGRGRPRPGWLALLALVQPLRLWVLLTLGRRWNTRAAVPCAMTVATGGPYRAVRHPNYTVVVFELAALPLAFGLSALALMAGIVNAALLSVRIAEEEAALQRLPGYTAHFRGKPRFLPWLF